MFRSMKGKILVSKLKEKSFNNFEEVLLTVLLQVLSLRKPFLNLINK